MSQQNFSSNGLRTDYRESLADATRDTFSPLEEYYKFIFDNSVEKPHLRKDQEILDFQVTDTKIDEVAKSNLRYSIEILYMIQKFNEVPPKSGLNWGLSVGSCCFRDAYIRIPKEIQKENNQLFKPHLILIL